MKRLALILVLIGISSAIAGDVATLNKNDAAGMFQQPTGFRNGSIKRIIDGDTVEAVVDLGESVYLFENARLIGMNAKEHDTPAGDLATAHLKGLPTATVIELCGRDKYGRLLVRLWALDIGKWVNLNQKMIDDGFAKPWNGQGIKP